MRLWVFLLGAAATAAAAPLVWRFLRDYQKNRIYTFLDPESDPLGAGYHILQSKIAFGSGGLFGKGFLLGTQSHLNFLPEKQTDFIFTSLAEEFGLVGGLTLLALYTLIIIYGIGIAMRSRNQFGRILGLGIVFNFFLYVFINTAMVMGMLPVVGVPAAADLLRGNRDAGGHVRVRALDERLCPSRRSTKLEWRERARLGAGLTIIFIEALSSGA